MSTPEPDKINAESEVKGANPALHPGRRYTLQRGRGFVANPGQVLVSTSMGWLRATRDEREAGCVLLPKEGGGVYRAEIIGGP